MARRKTKSPNPIKRWWRSQKEYHYQGYTFMTLFCLAASLYSFILLFFMDYASEASETMITLAWVGLIGGAVALFFVAPEFFYFYEKKQTLSEILSLDSRAEVMRRTREAEIAADLLGKPYQSSLKGHYESLGIKVPKRYSSLSAPDVQPIGSSEEE
tara:strand:- start:1970 stop:2440 length:471 start_codon:yes stop_codon:yes gene_type:complete